MAWVLKAHPLFEKDLKKLDKSDKERLRELILRIKGNPERFKPLRGYSSLFRVRFSGSRKLIISDGVLNCELAED